MDAWAAFAADPETTRFIGGPQGRSGAWRQMCAIAGAWQINGFSMLSVIEKATGRWVGRLGPWRPEEWPGAEVGWALAPEAHGKGYATEGATAAMDWVAETLDWPRIIHVIDPANAASQAVARRLGSRILGQDRLPPPFDDKLVDIWGQSTDEWRARRRAR